MSQSNASVSRIVEFLQETGLLISIFPSNPKDFAIRKVVRLNEATDGALAWLSVGQLKRHSQSAAEFKGSLLIAPTGVEALPSTDATIAVCKNPKLAFIRVVDQFFAELSAVALPAHGSGGISKSARIGERITLCEGVVIGENVTIEDDVVVGSNTVIVNAHIGTGTRIGCNCTVGLPGFGYERDEQGKLWRFPHLGDVQIGKDVEIGSNTCIDRGALGSTQIGDGCKIDNLVHIAHNVVLGAGSVVIANSMLGGSAELEEQVWVAPSVSILNQIRIGKSAVLGMGAVVLKSVAENSTMVGNPARPLERKTQQ